MKSIALKIEDPIFEVTEKTVSRLGISRNRYINDALAHYNLVQERKYLEESYKRASDLVREETMRVLKDFEDIDYVD